MNDIIKKAIADGEAVVAREKFEQARKDREAAERLQRYREECYEEARVWSREALPKLITEATAKGNRELYLGCETEGEARAAACRDMGLKVDQTYVPAGHDIDFGSWDSYFSYTVKW